jgi:alpha-glucosidase
MYPADTERPWWHGAVLYEIYVRSFQDSDGDGIGDLAGVHARLDYLTELGVDAVWLTPFFPSPGRDHGYDVAEYEDVDPRLGDLAEFDALLRDAHRRGLRVLIDFVPNHTSIDHPWFSESRSSRASARRNWYSWADPADDGGPPNNWLSVFGGPAWTFDERTRQYYLHSIMPSMPDLNWRHRPVEDAMRAAVQFWLNRGVDGLRIDCAHYLMKDPQLRDNPPAPLGALAFHRPMGAYDTQVHLHDKGHPDIHGVYRRMRSVLDDYGHGDRERISIGEVHVFDPKEWASYFGSDRDEMHSPFAFGLLAAKWTAEAIRGAVNSVESVLPAGGWPVWALGNHDEARVASRVGAAQARTAMMLLLTLHGTPVLFQGEELALPSAESSAGGARDPWASADPALSRDPARGPMPWTAGTHRGFTVNPEGPWLPAYRQPRIDVHSQELDNASMLSYTRNLLRLRKDTPALRFGAIRLEPGLPAEVLGYRRCLDNQEVLVMLNLGAAGHRIDIPDQAALLLSTRPGRTVESGSIALAPHEGLVIGLVPSGARIQMVTRGYPGLRSARMAPCISAMEMQFNDGEVTFGMMGASTKLRDLRWGPRIAVHCPTIGVPDPDPADHLVIESCGRGENCGVSPPPDPVPGHHARAPGGQTEQRLPLMALSTLAAAAFAAITTEVLPVGLLKEIGTGLGASPSRTGMLVSVYAIVVAICSVPLAALARRWPARSVLCLLLVGYAVSNAMLAGAGDYWTALVARLLGGFAHAGFFSVVFVVAVELTPSRRGRAVAVVGSGVALALALGVPAATAVGAAAGWRWAFAGCAVAMLLLAALTLVALPSAQRGAVPDRPLPVLGALRNRRAVLVSIAIVVLTLGQYTPFTYFTPLVRESGVGPQQVSIALLGYGCGGLLGVLGAGVLADRRPLATLLAAMALAAGSLLVLGVARGASALTVIVVWGLAFGMLPTLTQTVALRAVNPNALEVAPAVVNAAFNIGIAGGAFIGSRELLVSAPIALPATGSALIATSMLLLAQGARLPAPGP